MTIDQELTAAAPGAAAAGTSAAAAYAVRPYPRTAIPTRRQLHMMNRMGCGYSRATFAQVKRAGERPRGSSSSWTRPASGRTPRPTR